VIAALWGWLAGLIDGIEVGYAHLMSLLRGKSGRTVGRGLNLYC
jgi:hypothetical protein